MRSRECAACCANDVEVAHDEHVATHAIRERGHSRAAADASPLLSLKLSLTTPFHEDKLVRMPTYTLVSASIHRSMNIRKNGSREALVR
ncbi:hypothetical protein BCEP4_850008 [Burkholderia cepacia]|nr:hypothetical protein BCEP4_850008 [Burkholderia cepacia]